MKRSGAGAVYVAIWDIDVYDFIDLKKKNGDDRRRAHEIFPSLVVDDVFMERMIRNEMYTLFSPCDVKELTETYGEEFRKHYTRYEQEFLSNPEKFNPETKQVKAKDLFLYAITSYYENGTPFFFFKDNANNVHKHPELGIIRSSNLCVDYHTKILTKEYGNTYIGDLVKHGVKEAHCWNGEEWSLTQLFKTSDEADVMEVTIQPGNISIKATPYHKWYIDNGEGVVVKQTKELKHGDKIETFKDPNGKIHNLTIDSIEPLLIKVPTYCGYEPKYHKLMFNGVLTGNCTEIMLPTSNNETAVCNLGSVNIAKVNKKEDLERVIRIAVRAMDNCVDLTDYPSEDSERFQKKVRSIGCGFLGEAELLAMKKIDYGSEEHQELLHYVYGHASEYLEDTTKQLAKEKGSCVIDGVRNAYLSAIAPNSSSGVFACSTSSHEPIINKIWKEDRKSETITLVAPGINKDNKQYYKSAFDIDTITQVRMNGIRQKYIDMGISFNLYVDSRTATAARLRDILVEAWKCKLKTTYYLRSKSPTNEDIEEVVIKKENNGIKCVGCEN